MSARRVPQALALATVLIAGCGGSSHSGGATSQASTASGAKPASTSTTAASTSTSAALTPSNARIPVTFVIRAGDRVDPAEVSIPALFTIELTVISRDGRPHRVVLLTPTPNPLSVPANGRATIRIAGQHSGRFPLEVDGSVHAALLTGAEPGP